MSKSKPRKVVFFGSDEIALPLLEAMQDRRDLWEFCGVLTQPDRAAGRGRKLRANPIKRWALESEIPFLDPAVPDSSHVRWVCSLGAEIALVMAYGCILKRAMLEATPFGCLNLHASLLPKYRGSSPVETALAMGESRTGVTLMQVVPQLDAGPILDFETVEIGASETGSSLREKLADACVPLILRSLPRIFSGELAPTAQDSSDATFCRKLLKSDGRLDFSLSAVELERRIRAFSTWPGSFFLDRGSAIRVGRAKVTENFKDLKAGQLHADEGAGLLLIGTGSGSLQILSLQKPGGKMLPISDFLRGYRFSSEADLALPDESVPLLRSL